MNRLHLYRHRLVLILTLLGVVAFGGQSAVAQGTLESPVVSPRLIEASMVLESPGAVTVKGLDFTPGGAVFLALYDPWGEKPLVSSWVIASETAYGTNGSQDPAIGYSRGGSIEAVIDSSFFTVYGPNGSQDPAFGPMCGGAAMLRGYDALAHAWSNVFDLDLAC